MKINLNQENIDKCYRTLCAKEINMETAEFYIEYLTEYPLSITKKDIEKISKNHSIQESFFIAMKNKMEIEDDDDAFIEMNDLCNIKNIQKLSTKKYINNPFYKRIPVTNQKLGKWQLMKLNYKPYEGFVYDELDIHPERDYGEHTPLGFFEEEFPYLAIVEGDQIWMSVIPHEINTMDKPIKAAYGNILVLGLGIGYYAYMTSLKDDVDSITIIESDEYSSYLGECALIPFDSPINNTGILFYETLFDENASCHLALGMGFSNLIKDYEKYTQQELIDKGINDSMIHVDFMIGTPDMNIVGITKDNEEIQIFKDGNWAF